ncbi:hypothetical protein F5Y04DRAFT_291584 [Hypomontagnella monticulosa]|nr:hypothetical protein F5Y04DRAFT_291584 [Hypomontagnella monticulosa]
MLTLLIFFGIRDIKCEVFSSSEIVHPDTDDTDTSEASSNEESDDEESDDEEASTSDDDSQEQTFKPPSDDPFFQPVAMSEWNSKTLSKYRQCLLNFTPYLGRRISNISSIGTGSSGLYARLIPKAASNKRPINIMITARHVFFDDDKEVVNLLTPSGGDKTPTQVIQMDSDYIGMIKTVLRRDVKTLGSVIRGLKEVETERPFTYEEKLKYQEAWREIIKADDFLHHCIRHQYTRDRVIGTVVASPSLGSFWGTGRDWAAIGLSKHMFGSTTPPNRVCVAGLSPASLSTLRSKGCIIQASDDTNDSPDSDLEFIEIITYFTRRAISALKKPIDVYMSGAMSSTTHGILNQVYSYHWTGKHDLKWQYCVLDESRRYSFSQRGDSGSVVFAVLPASVAATSTQQPSSADGIRSTEQLVVGALGFLVAGCRSAEGNLYDQCDISHVTPFDLVKDSIEDFTGYRVQLSGGCDKTDEVEYDSESSDDWGDSHVSGPSSTARWTIRGGLLSKIWEEICNLGESHRK